MQLRVCAAVTRIFKVLSRPTYERIEVSVRKLRLTPPLDPRHSFRAGRAVERLSTISTIIGRRVLNGESEE